MPSLVNAVGKFTYWLFRWLYTKVLGFVHCGASEATPTIKNSILMESATSLASRIRRQKVTSLQVVQSYVHRIREVNEVLNCVVEERFEEALAEAKRADEAIRSGVSTEEEIQRDAPFLGVPFTCSGPWPREGLSLMRAAGAIFVACTKASEPCLPRETRGITSERTCNPYDTRRSAGAPCGGEACLIASCGSPLGIAPKAIVPCAFNGVFGHRPSESARCNAVGPISRNPVDLLPALTILTKNSLVDLRLGEAVKLENLKYYFMDDDGGSPLTSPVHKEIKEAIQKAVHHCRNVLKAPVERVDLHKIWKAYLIWKAEETGAPLRASVPKGLGLTSLLALLVDRAIHSYCQSNAKQLRQDCSQLLKTFQDLLGSDGVFIYPSHPTAALRHGESFARPFDLGYAAVFETLGLPSTHCPTGLDFEGLPIGFQIVGGPNQDRLTVAVAQEMDRIFGGWKPPPTRGTFTLKSTFFCTSSNEKVKVL